jgi:protein-tyrosine-phosphatase
MVVSERVYNVLFLCTHNSARSIIAEAVLNRIGRGRFRAFSAGSHPADAVNPSAQRLLSSHGFNTSELRSKSWDEFAAADAPKMDFVFTVCDDAANEVCPVWPGQPMTAHWGVPDPSMAEGTEAQKAYAFSQAYRMLRRRIELFLSLPLASIERLVLQRKIDEIGQLKEAPESAA